MKRLTFAAVLAGVASLGGVVTSVAQEAGLTATARVTPTLRWEDNAGTFATTGLSFGLQSVTRNQEFRFSTGTSLRLDEDGAELRTPSLDLSYARSNKSTLLTTSASLRRTDISTQFFLPNEDFTSIDLITDRGTRSDVALSLGLQLGRDAPLGLNLEAATTLRRFNDTVDPELFDTTDSRFSATALFRIDPLLTARAGLTYSEFDTEGQGTDRTREGGQIGVDYQATRNLSLDGSLSYDRTRFSTGREEEGTGASLSASLALPNGTFNASATTRIGENGRRTTLRLARAFDLKEGDLSFSYGLTRAPGGDANQIFGLNLSRQLTSLTNASLALSQEVATDNDANDILRFRASGNIGTQLSDVSRLSAGLSLFSVEAIGAGEDTSRLSANINYSRRLTDDWSLTSGVTWQRNRSDRDGTSTGQAVFVGLDRAFVWRP